MLKFIYLLGRWVVDILINNNNNNNIHTYTRTYNIGAKSINLLIYLPLLVFPMMLLSACERRHAGDASAVGFFPAYPCVTCDDGTRYCSDVPKQC